MNIQFINICEKLLKFKKKSMKLYYILFITPIIKVIYNCLNDKKHKPNYN